MLKTVSNLVGLPGTLSYQGTWNASTNTPTLVSSVGTLNNYYVVSVAGTTNLNGITTWSIGDWAIFSGTAWEKINGGTTESFSNVAITSATGYVFANGANNVTASPNVPVANVTGAVPNTVYVLAGSGLTGGGALTGNVTLTATNINSGTVTQVQGNGTVNGITLTGNVTASGNLTLGGTLSSITNAQLQNSAITITGTSVPLGGSIPTIPVANISGAVPNTVYVIAGTGLSGGGALTGNVTVTLSNSTIGVGNVVIALGGATANIGNVTLANVTIQSGAVNVTTLNHLAAVSITATYGNASLPLQPLGFIQYDLNGTIVKVPYYAV